MIKALHRAMQKDHTKLVVAISLTVIIVLAPYLFKFWDYEFSKKTNDWGNFGAYVGGLLSPLFAVGSLYYVVKTFRQQSFETTFNLLLEQHNTLAESLSKKQMIDSQDGTSSKNQTSPIEDVFDEIGPFWLSDKNERKKSLNENYDVHKYVRVVYQILKFIDDDCPSDKFKYSRIFRSFISNDLNFLLALNCAQHDYKNQFTFPKYKRLIEKYQLLEHLIPSKFVGKLVKYPGDMSNVLFIARTYDRSAFGDGVNIKKFLEGELFLCKEKTNLLLKNNSDSVSKIIGCDAFVKHSIPNVSFIISKGVEYDEDNLEFLKFFMSEYNSILGSKVFKNSSPDEINMLKEKMGNIEKIILGVTLNNVFNLKGIKFCHEKMLLSFFCGCDENTIINEINENIPDLIKNIENAEKKREEAINIAKCYDYVNEELK